MTETNEPGKSINYEIQWKSLVESMREMRLHAADLNSYLQYAGYEDRASFKILSNWAKVNINNTLLVSILGAVNSGKSTFFNLLCGKKISPVTSGITTYQPLAVKPLKLDPEELRVEDLLPGDHKIYRTDNPHDVCDENADDGIYLIEYEHESLLEYCVIIDCPDYNSVAKRNRERANEITEASDVILLLLTGESAFSDETRKFFTKIYQLNKKIVVVLGKNACKEILDAFCSKLEKEHKINWKPEYVISLGYLSKQQLENPTPDFFKETDGYRKIDFNSPEDRAKIKYETWKRTY